MDNDHASSTSGLKQTTIVFGSCPITIEDVFAISHRTAKMKLSEDEKFVNRIQLGQQTLQKLICEGHIVYGVTTGYGNSCNVNISQELVNELPGQLVRFLGAGLGSYFELDETRAIITARLVSLANGFSAVRLELLNQLVMLIQQDILPCVPQEGSVGASGDLIPLSYVAAVLCGERDVYYQGKIQPTYKVFEELKIEPLKLAPKEGLAITNGTSVMTGLACLAFSRSTYLAQLCTRITSLAVVWLKGNNSFKQDSFTFPLDVHMGEKLVSKRIRQDLILQDNPPDYSKITETNGPYSIISAPHIIGILEDALPFFRKIIEAELNSTNDNPIIDVDSQRVFHGGMFYGGHIAFVMDSLKSIIANLADMMDRQMELLVNLNFNNNILVGNQEGVNDLHMKAILRFKALRIAISNWTAQAIKLTMPASVFSRPTESNNQDKVSLGTLAARDCCIVLELTERIAAGLLITIRQAMASQMTLPNTSGNHFESGCFTPELKQFIDILNENINFITDDIPIEPFLLQLGTIIREQRLKLY